MGKATGRHQVEKLTDAACRTAKPGRHGDGRGLYLVVEGTGAKRWLLRVVIAGRRRDLGLGSYPAVGLSEARSKAKDNLAMKAKGVDPIAVKREAEAAAKAARATPTFSEASAIYLEGKLPGFRNEKHRRQWQSTLQTYAFPTLGKKPVDQITTADVIGVLRPIWHTKSVTASRLRGRIERILSWAKVAKHRTGDNPAAWEGNLDEWFTRPSALADEDHHPAISQQDAQQWFAALRQRGGMAAKALEFQALTAARSGEVRGATWREIDLERGLWMVPQTRMKKRVEHWVPLSAAAQDLLRALPRFEGTLLLFPSATGKPLSDMSISAVMRRMHEAKLVEDQAAAGGRPLAEDQGGWRDPRNRRPAVPHGLRSTFRDWCAETGVERELAETALAHAITSKTEAAYLRSGMTERRRPLMEAWSRFLMGREAANVIDLATARA